MAGKPSEADKANGKPTLTTAGKNAVIQQILSLDLRGFLPQKVDVEDMANRLLEKRDSQHIGSAGQTASSNDG